MKRRQATAVIAGAAIAVAIGAGVAIAAVALPAHTEARSGDGATAAAHGGATSSVTATPAPASTPTAPATAPVSGTATSDPAPSSSASASASAAASPVASAGSDGSGTSTGTGSKPAVKTVTPFVSYTQVVSPTSLQVGASISGIVESTGHCTVTATKGAVTVSGTFAADPQPSSTQCGSMTLSSAKFTSGTWSVVVSYSSPTARGTSAASAVTL